MRAFFIYMENIELLENEIWKIIPNSEEKYAISNYGRVYGFKRKKLLSNGKRSYIDMSINQENILAIIPKLLRELFTDEENLSKWKKPKSLNGEIWKDIPDYEGIYQVSTLGRIKLLDRVCTHYNSIHGSKFLSERIMKQEIGSNGYYRVNLTKNSKSKHPTVHRLVGLTFISNPENKPQINHLNGNKLDNRVDNLQWVSISENTIHAIETGLIKVRKGDECSMRKIDSVKAKEIKELLFKKSENKLSLQKIADICGTTRNIVKDIHNGNSWKHIII